MAGEFGCRAFPRAGKKQAPAGKPLGSGGIWPQGRARMGTDLAQAFALAQALRENR